MLRFAKFHQTAFSFAKCQGFPARFFSSTNDHFDDPGAPRVALCKSGKTIAMYHPPERISYEKTLPIPRDDPRYSFENVETLVSNRLHELEIASNPVENPDIQRMFPMHDRDVVPTVMELAHMFHTSKHRWFRRKRTTPYKMFKTPE